MAVRQQTQGRVLVITIDNGPIKNALDTATIEQVREVFENLAFRDPLLPEAGDDPDIGEQGLFRPHVVVLRTMGDVFCAGAHLGEMKTLGQADYQANLAAALDMGAMFRAVRSCPVPVVARVQGPAYGGGVGLVAACDIVVAGPRARFAFSEVKLGLVPGVISPLVVDRIGRSAARRYFLTAESIHVDEAYRIGLVDLKPEVGPPDGDLDSALDDLVTQTVESLLAGGPAALGLCKGLLEGVQSLGFARSAELTARMIAEARTGAEAQVALKAFLAKEATPWAEGTTWSLPAYPGPPENDNEGSS